MDRTPRAISRVHGLGVGLVGTAIAVSAPAPLVGAPGGVDAQALEVIGLVVVVLGGALLAVSHPSPHTATRASPTTEHGRTPDPASLAPAPEPSHLPALASATS